jgi:hypothetical protein
VANTKITSRVLADDAVLTANITDDAVTSAKLDTNIDIAGTFDVTGATTLDSTLNVAGNLGVGTTSPSSLLHLDGTTANTYLTVEANSGASNAIKFVGGNTWTLGNDTAAGVGDNDFALLDGTDVRITIDSSGKVGIRDTTPDAVLKVNSTGGGSELAFKVADASDNSVFEVQGGGTSVFQYGKVGIGITNPDQMLHVSKGSAGSIDSHSTAAITIEDNDHVTLQFLTPNDKQQNIFFGDTQDNAHGIIRYDHSTTKLHFGTDGDPNKMVLDNGQLSLGDSTPESGDAETPKNLFLEGGECNMVIKNTDATSSSQRQGIAFLNSSGTRVGTITITSSATGYATSSDYRLKENVTDMTNATTRLKELKPKRFNWIVDETNTLVDGFLAHEVSNVVPEAVTGEKDGEEMQGIDQSKLIPLLVKTIQELEARIKTLEDA